MQSLGDTGIPRPVGVNIVRQELKTLRQQRRIPEFDVVVGHIRSKLRDVQDSRIRPLINGTGILLHTNFGRAPLGPEIISALSSAGSNYTNLEYNLADGTRGGRATYLEQALAVLCGAEAATVVNHNAAALVLILSHFCRAGANEVVVSRGELVQIGGGFRIPDLLEASGARLREVGTTNRTSCSDYARAIGPRTALVLRVHRSNFFMEGFVESPSTRDLAALVRQKRVPFVEDLGSGAVVRTEAVPGMEHEPTPAEVIRDDVDLVCFSGDKLFGGPQAGLIVGRKKLITALKRDQFFRAVRCDKLVLSALEATVDEYLRNDEGIPVLQMMRVTDVDLRKRAERIVASLERLPLTVKVGAGRAQIGGGTLPRSAMRSITLDLTHPSLKPHELALRLRQQPIPVIGYVARGVLKLDLRTIFSRQDVELIASLQAVATP
jgi:L-seryl-tRNA(Ser) seleniumtransferase